MVQIITNSNGGGGVGLYKYKGSVDYYADLPTSGMKIGDTYNVVNAFTKDGKDYPAGTNVAWTGTDWDALGGSIDLSDYQKKLVEGAGIDIDGDTNEISVESTVINGAAAGATAVQPGDNVSELVNDAGYLVESDLKQSDWGQADSSAIDYIKNKPTIGNATLTIQKNGATVNSITMNATSNVTANISVPTKVSDLSNDSGFITKDVNDLTNYTKTSDLGAVALSNDYSDLDNKPDLSVYQTTANLVTDLTNPDDTHYPTAKAVADAISGGGLGDVVGPNSSTDGDVVLFDGATGKIIKDSGVGLSSKLDAAALSNNAYGGSWNGDTTHTPTKDALYDKIHTMDVEIGNKAADTTVVKLTGNQTIAGTKTFSTSPVVPSKSTAATNSDTAIATEAQVKLVADDVATINGKIPTEATSSNKLADKNYVDDSINSVTAYYITKNAQGDQWATYAELAAATTFYSGGVARTPTRNDYTIVLADENHDNATTRYIYNSGWEYQYTVNETALTQAQLDALNSGITSGKVSTYDGYASTISGKQDALTLPATPTQGNLVTWGANNKTLVDGGAIPSTADCVKTSGDQTIAGTKTFSTSPVVPSKTTDATNTGTAIATEAQVYKKQDTLVSGTNIKTVNGNSLLGSGNIVVTGKEYNAGEGIEIGTVQDYSAMQGPAPDGFHVPLSSEWDAVKTIWTALGGGSSDGTNFGIALKLPFAGHRVNSSSNVGLQGTYGYYSSSSRGGTDSAYILFFGATTLNPQSYQTRADGFSVRCFKNSPTVPTSSWTKLYGTSIEAGGIFWSSTDGLISLSSNGQTWITISDKNLGATTVWNSGDTLSEANCGKYYQRGNNYGFPRTGTIANQSTTQVDASNYGPGNYYSSDTFIKYNGRWDSTDNGNLWGGVTGIVTLDNVITNTGVLSVNGQAGDVTVTTHTTITVTLTSAGWSSNSQTVSATGVTASNTVIVSPAPADIADYADCGVYGYGQGSGTLTFKCDTAPSGDIVVNVLIMS